MSLKDNVALCKEIDLTLTTWFLSDLLQTGILAFKS